MEALLLLSGAERRSGPGRLRDRLADGIAQSVDQAEKVPTEAQKVIKPKYVDLNGGWGVQRLPGSPPWVWTLSGAPLSSSSPLPSCLLLLGERAFLDEPT